MRVQREKIVVTGDYNNYNIKYFCELIGTISVMKVTAGTFT